MTDEEVRQFDEAGCVTIDTPLTARQIADASAAFDRLMPYREGHPRASLTCSYYDPALLEIIQHPFFEQVAQRVLNSEHVHFYQTAIVTAWPEPDTPFSFWQHVDIQYPLADFRSVPKRIICSFFLWITDVNERRAPMMLRPGSHLLIAEERERDPAWRGAPAKVQGVPLDRLPALPYSEPIPLVANAGQVSVLTTAAVHGASVNVDDLPRKNLVITFVDAGVEIGLSPHEAAQKREYDEGLRQRLRPDRVHIIAQ
jgi:ectoine hydroxylase-related dioxygenase (phytanoyl-CoA dioxygenase family)